MSFWDIVVVTASNKNQAKNYEQRISSRVSLGTLPKNTIYKVITDDDGKRIGSGGATLSVIDKLSKEYDLSEKKTLLIHSGGDSKRIPQYSVSGKLFSPVLKYASDGTACTLFDELIKSVDSVPDVSGNGMLIMCGDILVENDGLNADDFKGDVTALTAKAPAEEGVNHGVFATENGTVNHFLHKCSLDTLDSKGAIKDGNVFIDTGIVFFSANVVESLRKLVESKEDYDKYTDENIRLNFYGDFLFPPAKKSTLEDYVVQQSEFPTVSDELVEVRKTLWEILKDFDFKICEMKNGRFIHFGTTKQFLELVKDNDLGWEKSLLCNRNDVLAYNSYVSDDATVNGYVENSVIRGSVVTGKDSIISGAYLENIQVPDELVVSVVELQGNIFCLRAYPIDCNPKENNLWEEKCFPVFDDIRSCGNYLYHFLRKDEVYNSCEKISFKDSFVHSSSHCEIETKIKDLRSRYYLESLKKNVDKSDFTLKHDEIECRLPLRLNFGGTWTDTPPFTNEYGGKVLNVAITLDNELPVKCVVRKIDEKVFLFTSGDLGVQKRVTDVKDIFNISLEDNNFSIHKSLCIACGLVDENTDLQKFIDENGGIEIITNVENVPKGSGLGTSSILCAAGADAMFRFLGKDFDDEKIYNAVLTMEQLMSTGGGWQDQVGGYSKGFKLCTTTRGAVPTYDVETIDLSKEFLEKLHERFVLIYTGQKRLARNLLKRVMGNVYNKDDVFAVMKEIRRLADDMKDALVKEDIDLFADLMNELWEYSKYLNNEITNINIENIRECLSDLASGFFICGAGGGGFLQVILKPGYTKDDVDKHLRDWNFDEATRSYDANFYI